jgi:cytochrome P450
VATTAQEQHTPRTALPPGPRPLPYLGHLLALRQNPLGFLQQVQRAYGDMATIYVGKQPAVLLFRPEYVRYVLVEHPQSFSNRALLPEGRNEGFANEGLLTIDGEKHRQQRRVVQPAFHKKQIEGYATIMQNYTRELLDTWHPGQRVNLSRAMQELTLRIVSKCLFSIDLSSQLAPLSAAFDGIIGSSTSIAEDMLNIRVDNPVTGYGKRMAAMRQLNMLIYTLIAQRRDDEREHQDVLSMLMSAESGEAPGKPLTEKQIHDHILTFLAAGHETTAVSLVWTMYLLAQHPEVRAELQRDLQTVLDGREPTLSDLAQLPYLDWVLNESLRLYPPAWMQLRFVTEDVELGRTRLPAGTLIILSQWVLHRLPELWQEPEVFQPERWNPAHAQQLPPGAYFPFGGGPRTCIGMPFALLEAKLILAGMLQRYTPQPDPGYNPGFQPLITLRPKRQLEVSLLPAPASGPEAEQKELIPINIRTGQERRGCRTALLRMFGIRWA